MLQYVYFALFFHLEIICGLGVAVFFLIQHDLHYFKSHWPSSQCYITEQDSLAEIVDESLAPGLHLKDNIETVLM